ncbi:glutamate 5-kinase [Geothrix sp. PMB-07]|uniref:glutamate 5-kinase n=1 Tax=Geothrix sp. PMB-07 TaxID=3068640 RepID=UPI0027412E78|nr:glutamate 5-kinase [Geothrix sp. PMB-07]WLT30539.1 glutamate 5-kinase [Geothrix sp. PMB-07]
MTSPSSALGAIAMNPRASVPAARRIIVKLGTQVVVDTDGRPALSRLYGLMESVAALRQRGAQPLLVSSGAVGLGARQLGLQPRDRPLALAQKQACAAVGQGQLMALYQEGFARLGLCAAQVLLTEDDFSDPLRHLNLRHTLETLLELGAIPVLNENDTVSTLELERPDPGPDPGPRPIFSDNDHLSALVAAHLEADLLILLSDVSALHTEDPGQNPSAAPLAWVPFGADLPVNLAGTSPGGRGGMASKVAAARQAAQAGVPVALASGLVPRILDQILAGEAVGTFFQCAEKGVLS